MSKPMVTRWLPGVGCDHIQSYVTDSDATKLEAVVEAAGSLLATADGLRAFELEIREAIGNTNWQVLRDHIAAVDAAVAKLEGKP